MKTVAGAAIMRGAFTQGKAADIEKAACRTVCWRSGMTHASGGILLHGGRRPSRDYGLVGRGGEAVPLLCGGMQRSRAVSYVGADAGRSAQAPVLSEKCRGCVRPRLLVGRGSPPGFAYLCAR